MPARQTVLFLPMLAVLTAAITYAQEPADIPVSAPVSSTSQPAPGPADPLLPPVTEQGVQSGESASIRDIMLVLDNSVSMKTNDPQNRLAQSVIEFVAGLEEQTGISILLYGQDVNLVLPLVPATLENRERIAATLAQLDYQGTYSDSATALERAVAELKNSGRAGAARSIVFVTDGQQVQTADASRDSERTLWLQQEFSADTLAAGISIYSLGFAAAADADLVKTIALKTGGESFQAARADELSSAFAAISEYMQQESGPAQALATAPINAIAPVAAEPAVAPVPVITAPVQPAGQEDRIRSIIIVSAAIILIVTLGALIVLLVRRSRLYRRSAEPTVSEAYIYDLNGTTSAPSYKLGKKPIMFGRVAGKDMEHLDYIVIPESTIGRRHATIEYKDYAYWIMDQGSINGTFVNDVRVGSEVRLKHGDRIRLHKIEFDFVMPDLEEAGMTRVAEAAVAAAPVAELDIEAVRSSLEQGGFDLDLDFSGGDGNAANAGSGDETLMPGFSDTPEAVRSGSDEVTLMPGYDPAAEEASRAHYDDETLVPDSYRGIEVEDATLRPSPGSEAEDIFDVTGADRKDR